MNALTKLAGCLLFVALLQGCAAWRDRQGLPLHRQIRPLPPGAACRVAVLPFQNDSGYPLADVIFSKVFAAQIHASGDCFLLQEGDILKIYQQLRILPGEFPGPEQLQILSSRLDAQWLVTGTVVEMRENPAPGGGVNPAVAVDVLLRDGRDAEPLWGTYHRREGTDYRTAMHFGTVHTVTGLSQQVAREIINLWFRKGWMPCDVSPRL